MLFLSKDVSSIIFIAISSLLISLAVVYYPAGLPVLLAVFFVCVLGALVLKNPLWFFYFLALSKINLDSVKLYHYGSRGPDLKYALSLDGLTTVILLSGTLFYFIRHRAGSRLFGYPAVKPFILFLLICLFGLGFSPERMIGLRHFINYLNYFLIYLFCFILLDSPEKNRKMICAILFSSLVPLWVGFYQAARPAVNIFTPGYNRIYALTPHPNAYAYYLVAIAMFILTWLFYYKPLRVVLPLFILFIAVIISLLLTYTRGAWLAMALGIAVFMLILRDRLKQRPVLMLILTLGGGALILYFILSLRGLERISAFSDVKSDSLWTRVLLWRVYFKEFVKHPLIGQGLASCNLISQKNIGYLYEPHNDYLKLLVESGIFALCAYLGIIFSLLKFLFYKYKNYFSRPESILAAGAVSVIFCFALGQSMDNLFNADTVFSYFWFFIGVSCAFLKTSEVK